MIGGVLVGLIVGVAIGYFFGRQSGEARAPAPVTASIAAGAVVTKRGRKAGLKEDDFAPSDDILRRMHEAWERGEVFEEEPPAPPVDPTVIPLTDLEEKASRVLARLQGGGAEGAPAAEPMPEPEQEHEDEQEPDTVSAVVNDLVRQGYGDDLRFDGGHLRCRQCGEAHDTKEAEVEQVRRFEGPSDPADEAIVLAIRCPRCGAGGVLVSPYGPDADPELAEAFTYLASRAGHG